MHCRKALAYGLAVTMVSAAAHGITEESGNPFQKIVDRNVFGLKPPPPPPSTEPPKAPAPKITLTGTMTWKGKKKAFLKTPPPPVKPGEQPKGEQYYIVEEGGQDREMEVLEIDEKAGTVKVKYAGSEPISLNYTDNGAKPIAAGPVPGVPQPGMIPPPPTGMPGVQPSIPGSRPLPTRTLRLPTPVTPPGRVPGGATGYTPSGAYIPPSSGLQVATAGGNVSLPAFNISGSTPAATQQTAPQTPPAPQLTPEQQAILMEVQREQNTGNPNFPPLPPTPLGQELQRVSRP